MITIEYCAEGEPVSDFNYTEWLHKIKNSIVYGSLYDITFKVSTSLPINVIRLAIVKGELNYKDITFKYKDKEFQTNQYGVIEKWPNGFCEVNRSIATDLIKTRITNVQKKQKDRERLHYD